MDDRDPGTEMLGERLEAYAQAVLSPDREAVARMRARVMREARFALNAPSSAAPVAAPRTGRWSGALPWRRLRAYAVAASLIVVVGTAWSVASRPGGLLFDLRLSIDSAFMPSGEDARLDAELAALQGHIRDATLAAERGDIAAMEASLRAFGRVIDQAAAEVDDGDGDARLAKLEDALAKHQVVLEGLLAKVPDAAKPAIQNALARSGRAIDVIEEHTKARGPDRSAPPRNGQPNRPSAKPSPNNQGGPQVTRPPRTPKPDRTPPGHATDRPQRGPTQ